MLGPNQHHRILYLTNGQSFGKWRASAGSATHKKRKPRKSIEASFFPGLKRLPRYRRHFDFVIVNPFLVLENTQLLLEPGHGFVHDCGEVGGQLGFWRFKCWFTEHTAISRSPVSTPSFSGPVLSCGQLFARGALSSVVANRKIGRA